MYSLNNSHHHKADVTLQITVTVSVRVEFRIIVAFVLLLHSIMPRSSEIKSPGKQNTRLIRYYKCTKLVYLMGAQKQFNSAIFY